MSLPVALAGWKDAQTGKNLLPKDPVAFAGDDLELTCLLTSNEGPRPPCEVWFEHRREVLTTSSRLEVHVVNNDTVKLVLRHVTTDDEGIYYCVIGHSPNCSRRYYQHQHLLVFDWSNELHCVSSNFERLECHWNCPEEVRWEYNISAAWLRTPARYTKSVWSGKHRCKWSIQQMLVDNSAYFLDIRKFELNFSVSAFHENGYQLKTQEYQVVPEAVVRPNKPENLKVTDIASRDMTLTWRHPSGLGPDVLPLRYQVRYTEKNQHGSSKSKASAGSKTSYILRDLRPGSTYQIEVRARPKTTGKWSQSEMIEVTTKEEAPLVSPAVFMAFSVPDCPGTCRTVDLFWKINTDIYTAGHILGCTVNVTEAETGYTVMLTNVSCNDGHVIYGKRDEKHRYLVQLTAFTKIGTSPPAQWTIPAEKERPLYPQLFSAERRAGNVTIRWTRPNWNYTIDNYTIFYCDQTFHKCKNLQAVSVRGTQQQVKIPVDSRYLTWSISAESGTYSSGIKPNVLKCVYMENKDTQEEHTLSWDTRNFTISPTEHFTNYSVTVTSIGAGGESQSSVTTETQPAAPADPPRQVMINSSKDNQLIITWLPPETPNGRITKYEIAVQQMGSTRKTRHSSKSTSVIVSSLPSNTTFTVVVTAYVNDHLGSPPSIPVKGTTQIEAPDEVANIDVHTLSTREDISRINISWSPPQYPAAYIQRYQIQVQQVEKVYVMYTKRLWIDIVIPCNGTYSGFVVQIIVAAVNTLEETGRTKTVEHRVCHFLAYVPKS